MFTVSDSSSFFPNGVPRGLPEDSAVPDFSALSGKARSIDTACYPLGDIRAILTREHDRLGAGQAARDAVSSISGSTVFVIAGQQAGLFGGPLYSLYKAMHAVRLAARIAESTGLNAMPLFWVASDDHDFEEVAQHAALNRNGEITRISYRPEFLREGGPVGDIVLDTGIDSAVAALADTLPPGDMGGEYLALIRESWRSGVSWNDAFSRQMLGLFRDSGLILFDPRWQGVKELFRDIYRREIADPLKSSALVNEEAEIIERERGRRALRKPEGSTNLFLETAGVRSPLHFHNGTFSAGSDTFALPDIETIIEKEPERLSPGAALRPVCQDAVFPAAALIGGPGERLYLSQLGPLYQYFDIAPSTVWPRASFTVIDRKTARNAERESVPLTELFSDFASLKARLARDSFPADAAESFEKLETAISEGYDSISNALAKIDASLTGAADKEKGRALHSAGTLRDRAVKAHKATLDISENRLKAASAFLMPEGSPQERTLGVDAILPVLAGEGFGEMLSLTSPGEERHRIIAV